jgi:hypothetical protein
MRECVKDLCTRNKASKSGVKARRERRKALLTSTPKSTKATKGTTK